MECSVVKYLADLHITEVPALFGEILVLHWTATSLISAGEIQTEDAALQLFDLLSSFINGEIEEVCTISQPPAYNFVTSIGVLVH